MICEPVSTAVVEPDLPVASRSRQHVRLPLLLRPSSLGEARAMFDAHPGAHAIAGGLDVVNRMKEGWRPDCLIALDGVQELARIALNEAGDELLIGAMVTHDAFVRHAAARRAVPALTAAWEQIANIRIRMQGTIAGNVLARMPGYEAACLLAAVDADVVSATDGAASRLSSLLAAGSAGVVSGFVSGFRVRLPEPGVRRVLVHDRSLRPALTVTLGLALRDGTPVDARAVLGGCHAAPILRVIPLDGRPLRELHADANALAAAVFADVPLPTVPSPWRGEPSYRLRAATVLLTRALQGVTP